MPVTPTVTNMNQVLTLTPAVPLTANTTYTISVTGVKDFTGNTMVGTTTASFTTGLGVDDTPPSLVSVTPADGVTSVPVSSTIKLLFSKVMNPISFDSNSGYITLATTNTAATVAFTVTFSVDLKTATLTPTIRWLRVHSTL